MYVPIHFISKIRFIMKNKYVLFGVCTRTKNLYNHDITGIFPAILFFQKYMTQQSRKCIKRKKSPKETNNKFIKYSHQTTIFH